MWKPEEYETWEALDPAKTKPYTKCVVVTDWKISDPLSKGDCVLFLSEIVDMPGHVAVVNREGKVLWGYHDDNFKVVPADEG